MGWSGSLSASSAVGSAITYTPDTSGVGSYTVGTFKAPKKGVYRFQLKGSGGQAQHDWSTGGTPGAGGNTTGYLLLEANQTVYIGAGGPGSAAFVAKAAGSSLANIAKANLHFVAGAGGGNGNGDSGRGAAGGKGGGSAGEKGGEYWGTPGDGATQTSGYAYGTGEPGRYTNRDDVSCWGGRGGDGLYGGYCGKEGCVGGGGGSGYVYSGSLTVNGKTYASSTAQGGGAAAGSNGSVVVTYYAQAELPVTFDGVKLTQILFNGTQVGSLIVDGVKLFMRAWGRTAHKMMAEVV